MTLPSPPYTDGQIIPLDGVTYVWEAANKRLKVKTNDVSPDALGANAHQTPEKANFSVTFANTPPGSPTTGQAVIVGSSPTGVFAGHANALAVWNGASWQFTAPYEGMIVWDADNNVLKGWIADTASWTKVVPDAAFSAPDAAITRAMLQSGSVSPSKLGLNIISRNISAAPAGVAIGTQYIVKATPAGGDPWFGQSGKLATKTGAGDTSADWAFENLASGRLYWIADEGVLVGYNGTLQVTVGPATAGSIPATAIGTMSDLSYDQVANIGGKLQSYGINGTIQAYDLVHAGVGSIHTVALNSAGPVAPLPRGSSGTASSTTAITIAGHNFTTVTGFFIDELVSGATYALFSAEGRTDNDGTSGVWSFYKVIRTA